MSVALEPELPGLSLLQPRAGTELEVLGQRGTTADIRLSSSDGTAVGVLLELELAGAIGYWHPAAGVQRTLVPDWSGQTTTSLVQSAPVGVLHDAAGRALFGWAADQPVDELQIRFGVSEEHKTFVVELTGPTLEDRTGLVLRLVADEADLASAVRDLGGWMSARISEPPLAVPEVARRPVYSSWYTFTQEISADLIEEEAQLAVPLGCGMVFLDDGWQQHAHGRGYQGLGDWLPDPVKFPDLGAHVRRLHDLGLGVALWVAPLSLGAESSTHADLEKYAPYASSQLHCRILDPRYREVREHLADTCLRLVTDYGVDALKVDFLDTAMHYQGTESPGDIADVGVAMAELLSSLRRRLVDAGHGDVVFEFRQPYVSPAISRFGQILRAGDCPADAVLNRQRTIDCRLLAAGPVVHSDPLMWGPTGGPEAVAQQIYAALFSVPQISMRLAELPPEQALALGGLLALWQQHADVLLTGELRVQGSEASYSLVTATRGDLGQAVAVCYTPQVVELDLIDGEDILLVNATGAARLAVRTSRPIVCGSLRDAAGSLTTGLAEPLPPGLHELPVVPWGSVAVRVEGARPRPAEPNA